MHEQRQGPVEDLSAYVISGRVVSHLPDDVAHATAARTVAQGIDDGVEAERLGFANVFLSERWNLKESAVVLGAIGARTQRIGLGTGLISPARRHVLHTAAFGATMQAAFGPRFVLGLGRGEHAYLRHEGLRTARFDGLIDYVAILRRLWAGETVDYEGPAGSYSNLKLGDVYAGPAPRVWYGTFAREKAAATVAAAFDGVLLPPMMTPQATAAAVQRLHDACRAAGCDPAQVRIAQCVVTAPDLSEEESRALAHARAVTYLQAAEYGVALTWVNGWDFEPVEKLRAAATEILTREPDEMVDTAFHRVQLMDLADLVPDEWMTTSCALGTAGACAAKLAEFRAAGADEVVTYGSTPGQNAALIEAWQAR